LTARIPDSDRTWVSLGLTYELTDRDLAWVNLGCDRYLAWMLAYAKDPSSLFNLDNT